ncbi:integrase [Mycobacterium riyadhense]|uniref:Integrase n=1 Tax=Mycobacterium riyadhense TaxID=486698 RepID=A0A1X2D7B8_9MYCO|nr:integrase [Mycobacterium riyadhense]MCV7146074.1 integrase [Mycobacterium riyadhense]ORW84052.1 integrase [Mycobacterium riyadhense]VTP00872.1 hypothetical protein BIN_B_03791 [Mycobacterium riyadhense]
MRISRRVGRIGCAAIVVLFVLACGAGAPTAPVIDVALVTASQSICGATYLCAADPAPDAGDQATAEQRIIDGYVKKQIGCTPDMPSNPQSVTWDPPGFRPYVGGSGNINDSDPRLGGHFTADYVNGRWHIAYLYC